MAGRCGTKLAVIFIILVLSACAEAGVSIYFDQETAPVSPVLVKGQIMIPLGPLVEYAGADLEWLNEEEVRITRGGTVIVMRVGDPSAEVNGAPVSTNVPPQEVDKQIVFPLRFLVNNLSLSLEWDSSVSALRLSGGTGKAKDSPKASIERAGNGDTGTENGEEEADSLFEDVPVIESVRLDSLDGRPLLVISSGRRVEHRETLLANPARLVIDVLGVRLGEVTDLDVDDPVVSGVRVSQFEDTVVRIVLDLSAPTGYAVKESDTGLSVHLFHQVSGVTLERLAGRATLSVLVSGSPRYEINYLQSPERLVLDVFEASLTSAPCVSEVDDPVVKAVRVSQFAPGIARIVLDLKQSVNYLPVPGVLSSGEIAVDLWENGQPGIAYAAEGENDPPLPSNVPDDIGEDGLGIEQRDGLLRGVRIVLDPGHGGVQPGAVGPAGTFEKDVNLAIASMVEEFLKVAGAEVILTRRDDRDVQLNERAAVVSRVDADLFVSIHANAFGERDAHGTETLYNPVLPENARLAAEIQQALVSELGTVNRGTKVRQDLAVLRNMHVPAVLVEVAFIDHPHEERLLRDEAFQRRAAEAIALGIAAFIGNSGSQGGIE